MEHPLIVFEKYQEWLDEKFDDSLIIEYHNPGKPVFKVLFDPTVDEKELQKAIPKEWRDLERDGKVTLDIREYIAKALAHQTLSDGSTEDCEEHQRASYIVNVLMKDKKEELMRKLQGLTDD